jgi:hypothetical protein
MPTITFSLEDEPFQRLLAYATYEERTPDAQAKILVLKALDLYKEYRPKVVSAKAPPTRQKPPTRDGVPSPTTLE